MFSKFKRYFIMTLILIAILSNVPSFAAEWYEGGYSQPTILREWKNFSQKGKEITCSGIIGEIALDNYFKLPYENAPQIRGYAKQLILAIDNWISIKNNIHDTTAIADIAIVNMLLFDWINKSYIDSLPSKRRDKIITLIAEDSSNASNQNGDINTNITTQLKSSHKAAPKPKLMSKKAAKEWVKNNVHLRLHFPLEDMKYRLGDYQATTIGNIERYYFPRINMTFFVIKSSQEFIGFSESDPSQKARKEN